MSSAAVACHRLCFAISVPKQFTLKTRVTRTKHSMRTSHRAVYKLHSTQCPLPGIRLSWQHGSFHAEILQRAAVIHNATSPLALCSIARLGPTMNPTVCATELNRPCVASAVIVSRPPNRSARSARSTVSASTQQSFSKMCL